MLVGTAHCRCTSLVWIEISGSFATQAALFLPRQTEDIHRSYFSAWVQTDLDSKSKLDQLA
jgi:hypothetical protein